MQQNSTTSESDELLLNNEVEVLISLTESKENYRKLIKAAIGSWVKDFQAGNIKVESVDDLLKLIKADLLLGNLSRQQRYLIVEGVQRRINFVE